MSRKLIQITFSILLLAGMVFGLAIKDGALANALQAHVSQADPATKLESQLLTQLNAGPADFIVMMAEQADVSKANQLQTKAEKGQYVFDTLTATSSRTQADLRAYLDSKSVDYQSFYVVNAIWVKHGSLDLAQTIAARTDVKAITANHTYQLEKPIEPKASTNQPNYVEPNISFVKADQVWAMGYTGQGMVVADDDTGLDNTHPAIAPHFRGCLNPPTCDQWDFNYNWWDAFGTYATPYDDYGHGTHTAGTMVGDDGQGNQIGMAPGAQLISCKNMVNGGGDDAHFIICFEWNLAPWDSNGNNPDPTKAPDSVNNSWGYGGGGVNSFREVIDNLLAAGIVVEVSAGNEGSGCQTLRSPGDYQEVFTTGSVNHAYAYPGLLTGFSSRGPSILDGNYFPDFMAPGENVRSSLPGNQYAYWSGTSMAGPHVTALIALLWSANPALRGQIDTTYSIIQQTAAPLVGQNGSNCGGDYTIGPNNDWGYGTIDALAAANLAISYGGAGTLEGTVTDAVTLDPVAGVTVKAVRQEGGTWTLTTDINGYYQATVAAGTFDITASHPQYMSQTANNVVVDEDGTTVQDFSLTPRGWAYGTVYDYDNATPIAGATVSAEDGSTTTTDGSGEYQLWLDPGEHTLTAVAPNYAPESAVVTIVSGEGMLQDFNLQAAVVFIPSPINVSVPLGETYSQPATITNRLPTDYPFVFTEKDLGYLPLGGGVAKVTVKASPVTAPANTAVAVSGYKARPAGTVSINRHAGINDGANVLLLNADDDNNGSSPIHDALVAYGDLGAVDLYDARSSTPDLATLQNYNVVVVWSNYLFSDATGMGNVLADYVDAGGKVINMEFALDPYWGLAGRFITDGYTAMTSSLGTIFTSSCLGNFDPSNPIMDGVTNVCDLYRAGGTALTAGSSAVAYWQDNELFVAAKDDGSVVTINSYPGFYFQYTGQLPDVLHNAINFLAVPADVPWLSEVPVSGTVPAESSLGVSINFDASPAAGVTQPGTYNAELTVKGDPKVKVPVSMTVEAPADWGRLDGTVMGLGYCDQNPAALEGASVEIVGVGTFTTDANGYYATWLPEGTYTLNVTADGHVGTTAEVVVIAQENVTQDFNLRWDQPCITETPPSMEVTLDMGANTTVPMTLTNTGAGTGTFEMSDSQKGYTPMRQNFLPPAVRPSTPDTTPSSIGRDPKARSISPAQIGKSIAQLAGEPAFAMDVNIGYNLVTFLDDNPGAWTIIANEPGSQYFAGDFINGDFSTLYVIDYGTSSLYAVDTTTGAVTLIGPSTPYGGETWTGMTGATDGTMYASSTNISRSTLYTVDLSTGAATVVGEITNAPAIIDIAITPVGDMYGVDIVNDNLIKIDPTTGAGTVIGYIGFNANYAQGMDYEETSGTLYLAAYGSQGELRIADPATGNTTLVGAFPGGAEVDSLAFATGGGGDAPWLTETPITGTVAPDGGQQLIDVKFDASQVTQPGTYTGEVKAKTNDPVVKNYTVAATMNVTAPADWGQLSGTVTGLGYCDVNPAALKDAVVSIEGGLSVKTDVNGYYLLWLQEGTYNVTVTIDGYTVGNATVVVNPGGEMTVQNFDLRWLQPCMTEAPTSLSATLDLGQKITQTLTLTNTGAAEGTFTVKDSDKGYTPKGAQKPPIPDGNPIVPVGSSSGAKIQPYQSRINANDILLVSSTDVSGSIEKALQDLGYGYDYISGPPWTGIDFSPYSIVMIAMDGGSAETTDVQALRTNVIDQGKKLLFFGGTCYQPFAQGMNDYIVKNDTSNYCWQVTNPPQWTIVDSTNPLADGLPNQYNFNNSSAGYYSIRVNDADAETAGVNGEGYPTLFQKMTDGTFAWFIDSPYASYWADPTDYAFLKQVVQNSIESTGGGDALWLTENPTSGTLVPDVGTQTIDVVYDAGMVTQPGTYSAVVNVKTNDPVNSKFSIPVTMNVNGPPDWGRVEGTVMSLGYCDQTAIPLKGATVEIVGFSTLTTDSAGHYSTWLPEGTYTINVSADGHVAASAQVVITAQETTTQDFNLRLIMPCTSVNPQSFEVNVGAGYTLTVPLNLINTGAGDSAFKVSEKAAGLLNGSPNLGKANMNYPRGTAAPSVGPVPGAKQAAPADINKILKTMTGTPANAMELINTYLIYFESGNPESYVNLFSEPGTAYYAGDFIPGDFSTLYAIDYNTNTLYSIDIATGVATSIGPSVPVSGESWSGMTIADDGIAYASSTSISNSTLYTIDLTTGEATVVGNITGAACVIDIAILPDMSMYAHDICQDAIFSVDPSTGAGTYIGSTGFDANYAQGMDYDEATGTLYLAAFNNSNYNAELRAVDLSTGNTTLVGTFGYFVEVDSLGFAAGGPSPDVPWLSENPITGTIPADSSTIVNVTFDSITYTVGTTVTADLIVKTDDNKFTVPVTMHVVAPTAPVPQFSATTVGVGNPTTFYNLSDPGVPPAYTYSWDFGDGTGTTVGTKDPVYHTYGTFGTFTVTLKACNAIDCVLVTHEVTVLPKVFFLPLMNKH